MQQIGVLGRRRLGADRGGIEIALPTQGFGQGQLYFTLTPTASILTGQLQRLGVLLDRRARSSLRQEQVAPSH